MEIPGAPHNQFLQYENICPEYLLGNFYLKGTIETNLLNDQKI